MIFNEFGSEKNPPVLLMHGMLQKWECVYKPLKELEKHYRLIVPAMDGMYEGSGDFTSFADQAAQIEDFVNEKYGGHLKGAYGISQGALLMVEVLGRNNIKIDKVILDGTYVAHHGRISGIISFRSLREMQQNGGHPPKAMDAMMKLMGLSTEEYEKVNSNLYWGSSEETMRRNIMENYTYRTSPEIQFTESKVYLWCGSREPYAKKSHRILKKYLKNYEESIFANLGHGEALMLHSGRLCRKILEALGE